MTTETAYLYSINRVIHVDNSDTSHRTAIGTDQDIIYSNIEDTKIDQQFRVIGGTWTDDFVVRNIFTHNDDQTDSENFFLNIGCNVDTITVDSLNLSLATANNVGSVTQLYGKQIEQGETDTTMEVYFDNLTIGKDNTYAYAFFDETNRKIDLGTTATENVNVYSDQIAIDASTHMKTETPVFNINENSTKATLTMSDTTGTINLGGSTNCNLNVTTLVQNYKADTNMDIDTPYYEINKLTDNVYFKMDDANSTIQLGVSNVTEYLYLYGINIGIETPGNFNIEAPNFFVVTSNIGMNADNIQITGNEDIKFDTPLFQVNDPGSNTYFRMDEATSTIDIGNENTENLNVEGDEINVKSDTHTKFDTPLFQVNEEGDSTYFVMNQTTNSIGLGSETTSTLDLDGDTTTIVANTKIQEYTPIMQLNTPGSNAYMKFDQVASSIVIGGDTNATTEINGINTTVNADTKLDINAPITEINEPGEGGYLNLDNNTKTITMGSTTTPGGTENINMNGDNFTIDAEDTYDIDTNRFTVNKDRTQARIDINDNTNSMTLGGDDLQNMRIHGKDILIGMPGETITFYGNVVSYAEGSNIITNTVTNETSAFHVHNTGTETALTVIQDNSVGGTKDLALFITKEDQDRGALRIDGAGRVGLGIDRNSNIEAWFHVNRNDPDNTGGYNDMMRIDDVDSDSTPFIIKSDGRVGIGTDAPEYKIDMWNDEGTAKGIAIRDALYIKTDDVNKIYYNIGGVAYSNTDTDSQGELGFYLSWQPNSILTDYDADTYTFRVSCKFHAGMVGKNVAYRRFEALVVPSDDSVNYPAEIMTTDEHDSKTKKFKKIDCSVTRTGTHQVLLKVYWKYRKHGYSEDTDDEGGGGPTTPNFTRAYLDMEILAHKDLGDITIDKYSNLLGSGVIV
tara:strand:- start:21547 stop:24273 length:2727 start_codon:yes stop_codon:yes gene_type:complete